MSDGDDRVRKAVDVEDLPRHFEKNLELIFAPGCREATSSSTRTKNRNTTRRCAELRSLNAISLVRWTVAYPPTTWAPSRTNDKTFQTLLHRIKKELFLESEVCDKLDYLRSSGRLGVYQSDEFAKFGTGLTSLLKCRR